MIHLAVGQLIDVNARHLGGSPAVRDVGIAASVVARPVVGVFGEEAYSMIEEKAAALLPSVICTRPFVDANTRTGWAACRVFLVGNGRDAALDHGEVFDLVLETAASRLETWVGDRVGGWRRCWGAWRGSDVNRAGKAAWARGLSQ